MADTLLEDFETLKEALDVFIEYAGGPRMVESYGGHYRRVLQENSDPNAKPRLTPPFTDPILIAQWALQRVVDQTAFKGSPELGAVAKAALARAEEQAVQIIKDAEVRAKMMERVAGTAAVRIRQEAKEEAAKEARRIVDRARAAVEGIEDETERRVNERFDRMYVVRPCLRGVNCTRVHSGLSTTKRPRRVDKA